MPEPFTIGALVASTLAIVADATIKGVVSETVKDAYKQLKDKLRPAAAAEIGALEAKPNSQGKQLAIAEIVDEQPEQEIEALRTLALQLVADLKADAKKASPTGLDLERLTEVEIRLRTVTVSSGTGIRLRDMQGGIIDIENLNVGGIGGN